MKIGIFGASGFVGSALTERMYFEGGCEFQCFVHSSGNAGRIARLPVSIGLCDLMDPAQTRAAVAKVDAVVNCALGSDAAMIRGLRNLIEAAQASNIRKFVHLSSIATYGEDPAPESQTESGAPHPGLNSYGQLKLRQEKMVMSLHRSGVPCYILIPGNITGPYSPFLRGMAERLAAGPLPLVEGGAAPSNLIHVDNLAEAILAALRDTGHAGERYFVNETQPVSWRRVFDDLARGLGFAASYLAVKREDAVRQLPSRPRQQADGVGRYGRVLLSGEFRRAVSALPPFGWLQRTAVNFFEQLSPSAQARLRDRLKGPVRIEKDVPASDLGQRYVAVQVRRFFHSTEKLSASLGWRPPLSYERGLETNLQWLKFAGIPHRDVQIPGCPPRR